MSKITFKISAKTDVGLVRSNNEDNLCVVSNLIDSTSTWKGDAECRLGSRGALLIVADGMGGMNAGEVASEIAVSVVKECFLNELNDSVLASDSSIVAFMNDAIVKADKQIKAEGRRHRESKGMGTTIVVAWLYNGLLYVSWCGDSRAYIFNPSRGIVQISKDHSYVQDLVDRGVLNKEDAFDFPESNVITRCLSHSSAKAEPQNLDAPFKLQPGDTVLLCTDGLSGMIRDSEIADVMLRHKGSMEDCADALIEAAKVAAGSDNITVALCQITSVDDVIQRISTEKIKDDSVKTTTTEKHQIERRITSFDDGKKKRYLPTWLSALIIFIIAIAVAATVIYFTNPDFFVRQKTKEAKEILPVVTDSNLDSATVDTPADTMPPTIGTITTALPQKTVNTKTTEKKKSEVDKKSTIDENEQKYREKYIQRMEESAGSSDSGSPKE